MPTNSNAYFAIEENAQEAKRKKEERAAAKLRAEKSKKRKVIK